MLPLAAGGYRLSGLLLERGVGCLMPLELGLELNEDLPERAVCGCRSASAGASILRLISSTSPRSVSISTKDGVSFSS